MRPRRARLGCTGRARDGLRRDTHASMRPRRARLGCRDVGVGRCVEIFGASMRPRRARLGCAGSPVYDRIRDCCFNEAEARAPRMLTTNRCEVARYLCFNEAEARAPRMHGAHRGQAHRPRIASMRPRRARLGCLAHDRGVRSPTSGASMRPRRARLGCCAECLTNRSSPLLQ